MIEKTVSDHDSYGQLDQKPTELIIVRPDAETLNSQSLPGFVGICASTTGALRIAMYLTIIPPGGIAEPHFHPEHETAIYLLKGQVEICYGQGLKQCQVCETGDFIFTPPGVPHQPRNLSATEPVYVLAARNDPDQKEKVVPYDPTLET
ncbi:cupin [Dulcicalothrix desertica PCC 7102]|uniref:Cupin n=1 Tax=Dulcicalothrix desertica PCC 7102 TaxID=232991 RepID=A0A433VSA5_9CYAN|nr:cupin domain-containing protein [Dulcicalothrix desertica]RUT08882.1 cupin [Dulcicalothrix desertica PCC 7102]TWH44102.1 putative RmlC-like cupin family protein [Dulcicalothrix desertica PCC 7102]